MPQSIQALGIDDSYVYVGTLSGKLIRADKTTGAETTLASVAGKIEEMFVDASTIYFTATPLDGSVKTQFYALPKSGGTPTLLGEVLDPVGPVRADATHLYWIVRSKGFTDATGKIQRMQKVGGTVQTLAQNLSVPIDLRIDGTNVYFTEDGLNRTPPYGLSRVSKTGGSVAKLDGSKPGAEILDVDSSAVYYAMWEDGDHQGVYRIAPAGGAATPYRTGLFIPSHLEKSGSTIYYAAARYDLSNGDQGSLNVIETSGNVVTLAARPVRTFVRDSEAIYAMPGVYAAGRIERFCLNYATAPKITSFSGNSALTGGTLITITGERFASGARVTFDDLEGTVMAVSPTQIQVTTPRHVQGVVDAYVINPDGQSGRAAFYYDPTVPGSYSRRHAVRR